MIKLGANILSQTVQRALSRATADVSTTSERLSSGQRINKASDDAAGLAISASLNNGARIFTQGVRNLNDGLSAVNIAEGATTELGSILVRIQELATQASSETYSDTQRGALQKEATALTAEWNRIVESTSFNGKNLLTGSDTRTVLQGGLGSAGTLAVQFGKEALAGGFENSAGATVRASISSAGVQADDHVGNPSLSFDGRYVTFDTYAGTLVTGDSNFNSDVFKRDQATGANTLVSVSSAGALGNGQSFYSSISGDGRYVAFQSTSSNLVTGDSNAVNDVFVRDTLSGTTTRVSTSASGTEGNGASRLAKISQDGRFVVFESTASNLVTGDTNGAVSDIFRKDLVSGEIVLVSRSTAGTVGNGASIVSSISADGRYVSFESTASNLISGDTNGLKDIFVKDLVAGTLTRVSTGNTGTQTTDASYQSSISADGNHVAFYSFSEELVPGYNNLAHDIFVKNLTSGTVEQVSLTSAGGASNGNSFKPALSADGRYVIFYSDASNLVAGDTNAGTDSFVKDRVSGSLTRVSVTTAGAQASGGTIYNGAISADGRIVAFDSRQTNVVSGDTNGFSDVFIRDLTKAGIQVLAGIVVNNKASAKITIELAQRYQAELLDYRSKLGATTSRIGSFVNTLQSTTINYKAASSRITDADVAEESAKLVANSIRQQVATALLGQANQEPRIGLALLKGA